MTSHSAESRQRPGYLVKLVRDGIPDVLGGDGTVTYGPLDKPTHVSLLRRKLIEEAAEFMDDPCVEELADVLAVVDALAAVQFGLDLHQLADRAIDKASMRGGFLQGTGMFAVHPADGAP